MELIDQNKKMFRNLAVILLDRSLHSEIKYPVYHYHDQKYLVEIKDGKIAGFVSFRPKGDLISFDYDYVIPEYRGNGIYKKLFAAREKMNTGNLVSIETCSDQLKKFLRKNNYKTIKTNGSWSYFQKQL